MIRTLMTICLLVCFLSSGFGADFVKQTLPTQATISKIFFINSYHGFAVTGDGELLKTNDAGKTWKLKKLGKRAITDIHIIGRVGYLVGEKGLLMKTKDRGATWRDISLNLQFNFSGVGILNDSMTILCGTDQHSMSKAKGVLFQSFDYGKTWKKQKHWGNGYTDIETQPNNKIYLLAIQKVFHSINNGIHYFRGKYEGAHLCFGFTFMDDFGFIVGQDGYFGYSATHGRKWEQIDLKITKTLYAVDMYDKSSGVAVGKDGIVVFFNDNGNRFTISNTGQTDDLRTVALTDEFIFAAGVNGAFYSKERFPKAPDLQ